MQEEQATGYELLTQVAALELKVVESKIERSAGNRCVRIVLEDDPDVLAGCVLGLMFAIGVLSFRDARPRGISAIGGYTDDDEWTVGDLLRRLRFERGHLVFHADYVRGRLLKTTVEVYADGKIVLTTINRGEAATRWVARLQGKQVLTVVPTPAGEPPA